MIGPDEDGDGDWRDDAGPYAEANPIRFSTKYFDDETALGYWGYRYYSPRLGRWLSRAPKGETLGCNLYSLAVNAPTLWFDPDGSEPPRQGTNNNRLSSKQAILAMLDALDREHKGRCTHEMVGPAVKRLKKAVREQLRKVKRGDSPDENPSYDPWFNTLKLGPSPKDYVVIHELIHAWHDLIDRYEDEREDEGIAYFYANFFLPRVDQLKWIDQDIERGNCDEELFRGAWSGFWLWLGRYKDYGGVANGKPFKFTWSDQSNTKTSLGIHISCARVATCFNEKLTTAKACACSCLRFHCSTAPGTERKHYRARRYIYLSENLPGEFR
ncbi:MAG: hypothetical protein DRN81_06945 [Thermoproteota archaeon]|nr:MAG: hypothetical protein DRN81_06945 [Candidatus Korarchaeota archaeon]